MFFELSKQKVLIMCGVGILVAILILISFVIDNNFNIVKNFQIAIMRSKANIAYTWQKIKISDRSDSIKVIAQSIFGTGQYYHSGESLSAKSVPVLTYHGLPSEGEGQVPFENFVSHMFALKKEGWETVTLAEFQAFMQGEESLPDKSFLLTFDDGRKDTYYPVDPVLKDLGFEAVMFVITGQSLRQDPTEESEYYLSTIDLQKMLQNGRWEIESHSRKGHAWYALDADGRTGHFLSNRLWIAEEQRLETEEEYKKRIEIDLEGSKSDIEYTLGTHVTTFAFPFSDFGQESQNLESAQEIVEDSVRSYYKYAFYQAYPAEGDTFTYPDPSAFMIQRIEPAPDWTSEKLLKVLESGRVKAIPYKQENFDIEWRGSWGSVALGEQMSLKATEDTTGAAAALNGSYSWKDYIFHAEIDWIKGDDVLMIARYKDNDNYFACDFSFSKVSLKQRVEGVFQTIAIRGGRALSTRSALLGIKVEGNTASCLSGSNTILTGTMTGNLSNGGIGIHIWNDTVNNAEVLVNLISVDQI